jgi:Dyp-type peroxidase family
MSALELYDIQGNVLRGYGMPHGCHVFVRIEDATLARRWLARTVGRVTTAELQARNDPKLARNIAFSAAGLERLDVPPAVRAEFSDEFQVGMAHRSTELGDVGPSHPDRWKEEAFRSAAAHLVLSVYAVTRHRLEHEVDQVKTELEEANLKVLHERWVERQRHDREHFGFADGFAQPHVVGAPSGKRPAPEANSAVTRPFPPGEFLLGYKDLEGEKPPGPAGALGRNGTYMVYREFDQNVAAFRRFLRHKSEACGLSEEHLAAKIVGRWRNGTPLAVSPDDDGLKKGRGDTRLDDFGYADDRSGFRCPLGAHIRRANPRDAGPGLELSRRHRMIRRGMAYGPRLAGGALHDDGRERGLAFICFVADIGRQFEIVLGQWCNDGNAFHLGSEADLLLGSGEGAARMTIQGTPPVFLRRSAGEPGGMAPFVSTRGGEYFYLPGIEGLRTLAQGTTFG